MDKTSITKLRNTGASSLATCLLLTGLLAGPAMAQDEDLGTLPISQVQMVVPHVFDGDLRNMPKGRAWAPGDAIKEIPRLRHATPDQMAKGVQVEGKMDPLLDRSINAKAKDSLRGEQGRFPGQGFSGVNPPDPVGDVGLDYYIQGINSGGGARITIYDKNTQALAGGPFNLDTLGAGACANGLGDPIVLFDSLANRWMLSEFSAVGNVLCIYISQTSSPFGGWFNYAFTTPFFPDYPKYGVWPDAYYLTTNEASGPANYAFERNQMLAGLPAQGIRFVAPGLSGFGFQALTPADLDGATPPPAGSPGLFMRHRDDEIHNVGANNPVVDFLEIWQMAVNWANPALSTFALATTISIGEFDSTLCGQFTFSCIPQPGSPVRLDPLREVVMWRLQYRNFGGIGALVGNFVTDVNGLDTAGIRWFTVINVGGAWSLFDAGTFSPDNTNRWMGSAAMDKVANLLVFYNVSSSTVFPGINIAGRTLAMPPGTMIGDLPIVTGTAANASFRYGDYSSLNLDPVDDCTYWFTGEWNNAATWSTDISTFKAANCI